MMREAAVDLRVHGSCVALDGVGVLLRGPSGSGKSDLALRLIDGGAVLIADDLTELTRRGDAVFASLPARAAPETRGHLEVRGLGILPVPSLPEAPLRLVFDLAPGMPIERLPVLPTQDYLGVALPVIALDPFAASAAAKIRLAARELAA
jgi:HPr kinase/phosphorylase